MILFLIYYYAIIFSWNKSFWIIPDQLLQNKKSCINSLNIGSILIKLCEMADIYIINKWIFDILKIKGQRSRSVLIFQIRKFKVLILTLTFDPLTLNWTRTCHSSITSHIRSYIEIDQLLMKLCTVYYPSGSPLSKSKHIVLSALISDQYQ